MDLIEKLPIPFSSMIELKNSSKNVFRLKVSENWRKSRAKPTKGGRLMSKIKSFSDKTEYKFLECISDIT